MCLRHGVAERFVCCRVRSFLYVVLSYASKSSMLVVGLCALRLAPRMYSYKIDLFPCLTLALFLLSHSSRVSLSPPLSFRMQIGAAMEDRNMVPVSMADTQTLSKQVLLVCRWVLYATRSNDLL